MKKRGTGVGIFFGVPEGVKEWAKDRETLPVFRLRKLLFWDVITFRGDPSDIASLLHSIINDEDRMNPDLIFDRMSKRQLAATGTTLE